MREMQVDAKQDLEMLENHFIYCHILPVGTISHHIWAGMVDRVDPHLLSQMAQ
jgi:hypothetical protein